MVQCQICQYIIKAIFSNCSFASASNISIPKPASTPPVVSNSPITKPHHSIHTTKSTRLLYFLFLLTCRQCQLSPSCSHNTQPPSTSQLVWAQDRIQLLLDDPLQSSKTVLIPTWTRPIITNIVPTVAAAAFLRVPQS